MTGHSQAEAGQPVEKTAKQLEKEVRAVFPAAVSVEMS